MCTGASKAGSNWRVREKRASKQGNAQQQNNKLVEENTVLVWHLDTPRTHTTATHLQGVHTKNGSYFLKWASSMLAYGSHFVCMLFRVGFPCPRGGRCTHARCQKRKKKERVPSLFSWMQSHQHVHSQGRYSPRLLLLHLLPFPLVLRRTPG